jgi:hypothetical protein
MSGLKIDQAAGTFEIHREEEAGFRKYLKTRGIECDPGGINGSGWIEAPGGLQQSDMVRLQPIHREKLHEVEELYQSWHDSGKA